MVIIVYSLTKPMKHRLYLSNEIDVCLVQRINIYCSAHFLQVLSFGLH